MDPDARTKRNIGLKKTQFFKSIDSESLLKNILQISYNSFIVVLISFVFHLIMSRSLGPADYGELETLLTINSMLLIGLSAVSFVVARFVSYYHARQQFDKMKFLANWAFIFFFLIGMAGFMINAIFSKLSAEYLNIADHKVILVFGLLIWISFIMPIIEGILRGLQEFKMIGRYKLLDAALRLLIAGVLLYLGFKIKSILMALVIAGMITLIFTGYLLRKIYINKPYKIEIREIYRFALPVFVSCIALAILSNIDLVLVKHFFDAKTTGYYAAAAILAKISMLMAFGSAGVMFPKIVEEYTGGNVKNTIKTFKNTFNIVLYSGLFVTLVLMFFHTEVSRLFFGKQYVIGSMLGIFAVATFFLSLTSITVMFDLALKKYKFILLFVFASFIEIYQISILHNTVYDVVWTLFVINAVLLAFMIYYNRKELFLKYEDMD